MLQAYGRDLMEAQDWCRKYMRSGNVKDLTQAWDLYYHVFRRISKQLPQVSDTTESLRWMVVLDLPHSKNHCGLPQVGILFAQRCKCTIYISTFYKYRISTYTAEMATLSLLGKLKHHTRSAFLCPFLSLLRCGYLSCPDSFFDRTTGKSVRSLPVMQSGIKEEHDWMITIEKQGDSFILPFSGWSH